MKNIKTLLIILTAALFFTACQKEDSAILLNISGEVLVQDALTPTITRPLEGITVYLLNSPFTIDTINWWITKTDMLDSTLTDSNGSYKFSHLQAGNYELIPIDTTMGYLFEKSASSDNTAISTGNSQTDYTINFTTPEIVAENSAVEVSFIFKNSGTIEHNSIKVSREKRDLYFNGFFKTKWKFQQVGIIGSSNLDATNLLDIQTKNSSSEEFRGRLKIEFKHWSKGPQFGIIQSSYKLLETRYVDYTTTTYSFNAEWNKSNPVTVSQE